MSMTDASGHIVQRPVYDSIPRKSDMSNVIPRFFTEEVATDGIDPETGLKLFRKVEYVELLIPGDKNNAPVKRVNDAIRQQFSEQYRAFKDRGEAMDMAGGGLPLKAWPGIKSEIARGLEQINIFSVQQLAAIADGKLSQPGMMGLRDLREKARTFLDEAGKTAGLSNLQKQIDDQNASTALLKQQLQDMIERNNELTAKLAEAGTPGTAPEQMPELNTPRGRNKEK